MDEASALLQANLAKSHAPYYLMCGLAATPAPWRPGRGAALVGTGLRHGRRTATRLQWGASYVSTLIELTPQDEARIERNGTAAVRRSRRAGERVLRTQRRSLQRVGTRLQELEQIRGHRAAMLRLQAQLDSVCAGLPADDTQQRATCKAC